MSTSNNASVEPNRPDATIQLLNRPPITYNEALDTDDNIIQETQYVAATQGLYRRLWTERNTMSVLIKHHLGLGDQVTCTIAQQRQWIRGSFNMCIPVEVQSPGLYQKLILRCAMPHKLAETQNPGSVDEKMSCEVGTYAWIQERCPDIRIPHLYGFGFSDQRHFTHEVHRPIHVRVLHYFRRLLHNLIRCPTLLSRYTKNLVSHHLSTAYMLLEHIGSDNSQMLSNTCDKHRGDPVRRQNLFQGMVRIMLSLARIPQPKIGSFQFCNDGTITLTNRPLVSSIMILENAGTPMTIQRETTYTSTEPFIADMFHFHDKRFLSDVNMVYDDKDCRGEMTARQLFRMLAHHYIRRDQRNGPFFLQLDDFHASNIFVDADWNVTSLIDLEYICALPVESLTVPYWLTGCAINQIRKERWDEFNKVREEFMNVFEAEACNVTAEHNPSLGQIMRETWDSGAVWFWHGITSINAMSSLFTDHICPRFSPGLLFREEEMVSRFWSEDASKVVETKIGEHKKYAVELEKLFNNIVVDEKK